MDSTTAHTSQAMDMEGDGAFTGGNTAGNVQEETPDEEALRKLTEKNLQLGNSLHCIQKNKKKEMQCNCFKVFRETKAYCQAVAELQLMFSKLGFVGQKKIVIEWMRGNSHGGSNKHVFRMPFILHPNDNAQDYATLRETFICQNAMMTVLSKGYRWWRDCVTHHKNMTLPQHKLTGKVSNKRRKFLADFEDDLEKHFQQLEKEAEPIATRYVREVTGETTLRDNDDTMMYLPSYYTQRNCYAKFCLEERGMRISTTNKGAVKATPVTEGVERTIPSWSAYCTHWQQHYPKLKVRKPTEDICSYCYKFYNSHKFRSTNDSASTDTNNGGGDDDDIFFDAVEEEDVHQDQETNDTPATTNDGATDNTTAGVAVDPATEAMEKSILDAALHVKMARSMRQFVNDKIAAARHDRQQQTPHAERTYTFIADYCQNMSLPHFGKEQPGDTYYLTPSKLEGFGVADVSHVAVDGKEADHLYFHCYKEGYGAKGGINVASMLVKTLEKVNVMRKDSNGLPVQGSELNIVMDNCGGQNKNNHVLLLAPYLVELGYFKTVNMTFLVVGHTKNVCDRRFNNLKHDYHKSQVFTLEQAVDILSKSSYVTVWPVDPTQDWSDWYSMLIKPYKRLDGAKLRIQKNHLFTATMETVDSTKTLRFTTRQSALPEHTEERGDLVNPLFKQDGSSRIDLLRQLRPNRVLYKGLPGYKQVLLHKNYISFVPQQYHSDPLYQKPSKEVLEAEEKDQKQRKAYKKMKKEGKSITT